MMNKEQKTAAPAAELTDEHLTAIAWYAHKNTDKLNCWSGFTKDGNDRYTVPLLTPKDIALARVMFEAGMKSATAPVADAAPTIPADLRERIRNAVWRELPGNYYCGRVWSAWQVGTMSQDDFTPSEDVDEVLDEITDAVLEIFSPANCPAAPAPGSGS